MKRLGETKLFVYSLLLEWLLLFFFYRWLQFPIFYLNKLHGKLRVSLGKAYYDYNSCKSRRGEQKAYTELLKRYYDAIYYMMFKM